jgi:DNA-directed RNA polymerase subunit alpha
MPKKVVKDESVSTNVFGRFIAEPFETGYGTTIGNSLRRVLLSSIEGAAIVAVRIDGVYHEFCSIPGVVEDVTDIILNLKNVRLKSFSRDPVTIHLKKKGPCEVTAADIITDGKVEVVNPECYIATLAQDGKLEMEMEVKIGRGFCTAEANKTPEQDVGRIAIDSIFSPVQRVNFKIENTRVGARTDYERLILEIWTDGRVTPDEALTTAAAILRHHLNVFVSYDTEIVEVQDVEKKLDAEREELRKKLMMSVNEIELSVRASNCLNNANITTIGQLVQKTEGELLKYRNFGRKSLNEIVTKLKELGLSLGMKIDPELLASPPKQTDSSKE